MPRHTIFLVTLLLLTSASLQAAPIYYEVDNLSGNTWEYTYTVDNQLVTAIDEFTIWFDLAMYENLVITGSSSQSWDEFVSQPDPSLPDDGYADWTTSSLSINPGDVLDGFSVSFDFLGAGTPGAQFFETFDINFNLLSDGQTQQLVSVPPVSVPEPDSLLLFGLGLMGLFWRRSRRI